VLPPTFLPVVRFHPSLDLGGFADVHRGVSLTMRMPMLRFTRLTNAGSKTLENHTHAVASHCTYDHVARVHETLRVTPAMEACISDRGWSLEERATPAGYLWNTN
jgi:hypothetical protein